MGFTGACAFRDFEDGDMGIMNRFFAAILVAVAGVSTAQAQNEPIQVPVEVSDIKEAITQGVLISPRVNADWYNFAATGEAQRGARAGYYPRADLYAVVGREDRDTYVDHDWKGVKQFHVHITLKLIWFILKLYLLFLHYILSGH